MKGKHLAVFFSFFTKRAAELNRKNKNDVINTNRFSYVSELSKVIIVQHLSTEPKRRDHTSRGRGEGFGKAFVTYFTIGSKFITFRVFS